MATILGQGLDDEFASGVSLGDAPVIRDFEQNRDVLLPAKQMDPVVADSDPVDDHAEGNSEFPHHARGESQVVQAEGRRFRNQENEVRSPNRGDYRTRRSRRRVEDCGCILQQMCFHSPDKRWSHGHAYVESARDERDIVRLRCLDNTNAAALFSDGLLRAHFRAAAAAMAHLRKEERLGSKRNEGVVLTEPAAFAAGIAEGFIHFRHRDGDDVLAPRRSLEEKVDIRLFDIAVEQLDRRAQHPREVDRDRGLAGPTFAGRNCENQAAPSFRNRGGASVAASRRLQVA